MDGYGDMEPLESTADNEQRADRRAAVAGVFITVAGLYIAVFQSWVLGTPMTAVVTTLAAIGYFILPLTMVALGWSVWAAWKVAKRGWHRERAQWQKVAGRLATLERTMHAGAGVTAYVGGAGSWIDSCGVLRLAGFVVNGQPQTITLVRIELAGAGLHGCRIPAGAGTTLNTAIPAGGTQGFALTLGGFTRWTTVIKEATIDGIDLRLLVDCGAGVQTVTVRGCVARISCGIASDPAALIEPPAVEWPEDD